MKKQILLATTNKGKLNDVKEILKDIDVEILSFLDFDDYPNVEETGTTFLENAELKATAAYYKYRLPSFGDDSGLESFQLNGEPGIYSARYAGEDADDGKEIKSAIGEIRGTIIKNPRGKNGFGYDPLFIPNGYDNTMAELSHADKNRISHRLNAFKELKKILVK